MQSIQFDPKITADLQIDWQRPDSGQTADLFADVLADRMKQQVDADRRPPAAKRPHPLAESVSGKPPRPVIVHPRTVRGEAKEIDEPGARLGHEKRGPADETCTEAGEDTAAIVNSADTPKKAAETETATDAPTVAEQPAARDPVHGTDEAAAETEPVAAVAVVPAQQAEQIVIDGEAAIPVEVPIAEGEEAAAAPTSDPRNPSTDEAQDTGAAAVSQQAVDAVAAAALSGVAVDLKSDGPPAHSTAVPAVVMQPVASTAVPTPPRQTPLQISLVEKPIVDLTPAPAQPQPGKSSMDIKLRSGAAPRAQANAPAADPQPSSAQPSGYAPQATTPQPTAMGAFDGFDDTFAQPFSSDGSGPGWTLHLAQGAASRRADFVAQLRQHLQNLPAHEQVAVHIQRAVREGTGRVSVQLSPAELGRIHVKLEIDEDKRTTATVTVERPSTLELLQRDVKGLERALHSAGLSLDSGDLSFSLGHGGEQEFAQDLGRSAGSSGSGSLSDGEPAGELTDRAGAQVMDTAAGMVDVQV